MLIQKPDHITYKDCKYWACFTYSCAGEGNNARVTVYDGTGQVIHINPFEIGMTVADVMKFFEDANLALCAGVAPDDTLEPEEIERCFPFNVVIQDSECITLQQILSQFPAGKGIAGYDIDLKPINGHGRNKFVATTSDATMTGPHGNGDLDGSGSFDIEPERLPDNTYNRLDLSQEFCTVSGSVLNIGVSIIL